MGDKVARVANVPRRVWQGLTLWLIAVVSCTWWYADTQSTLFLLALPFLLVAAFFQLRRDIESVRRGEKDPQGITTVLGDLRGREDRLLLLFFALTPLAHRVYLAMSTGALAFYELDRSRDGLPLWFTFSAVTLSFAAWVSRSKETYFWIIATAFFSTYGLWRVVPGWDSGNQLARILWTMNNISTVLLAALALWLCRTGRKS